MAPRLLAPPAVQRAAMLHLVAAGDLIVTDLDGTLWRTEDGLHPATLSALRSLHGSETPLVVATGRRLGSVRRPFEPLGIRLPAVVLNGAMGVDLASETRFQLCPFPSDDAVMILDEFRAADLDPSIYIDDPTHEVVLSATPSTHPNHRASLGAHARTDDLAAVVAQRPVLMFSLIGLPREQLMPVASKIGSLAEVHVDHAYDLPGLFALTATPTGLSKWQGVLAWCQHKGLKPSRVIALGDGPNDVELLANADIALVPENAHATALQHADHVIPPADQGGWAPVLDHL